ncbi:hypothetical protein D3C78_1413860 [compost metagenome]
MIAFGSILAGSLHSPAAVPISSIPAKAKITPCTSTNAGSRPCGNMPPFSVIRCRPVVLPATGVPVPSNTTPTTRNSAMATTLIRANQNSISANHFTPIMFMVATTPSAQSANSHCGTSAKVPQ